jgi:hypothetical protein
VHGLFGFLLDQQVVGCTDDLKLDSERVEFLQLEYGKHIQSDSAQETALASLLSRHPEAFSKMISMLFIIAIREGSLHGRGMQVAITQRLGQPLYVELMPVPGGITK